jgi:nitrate/nitrite-specific signal transduction histidine kinase
MPPNTAKPKKSVQKVKNDGRSFSGATSKKAGLGLKIMDYRAKSIGASLDIRKGRNGGTVVTCLFPHKNNKPDNWRGDDQKTIAE